MTERSNVTYDPESGFPIIDWDAVPYEDEEDWEAQPAFVEAAPEPPKLKFFERLREQVLLFLEYPVESIVDFVDEVKSLHGAERVKKILLLLVTVSALAFAAALAVYLIVAVFAIVLGGIVMDGLAEDSLLARRDYLESKVSAGAASRADYDELYYVEDQIRRGR